MNTTQLIQDYLNKIPTTQLQIKYGIGWKKLTNILKENNVYKKNNSMSYSSKVEEYVRLNYWIMSNKDLAKNTGIQEDGVRVLAKRLGFSLKGSGWKFRDVISKLDKNSKEFLYFLGWIASDGCVNKQFNATVLKIADKEIIDKLSVLFPEINSIYSYKKRCENCKKMYDLHIFSKELALYLNSLGITPNKSKTLFVEEKILNNHFVRGFFEGDGHVRNTSTSRKHVRYEAGFVSASEKFTNQLVNYINSQNIFVKVTKEKNCFRMRISGKDNLEKFYHFIYKDCDKWYLLRKKQILDQLFSNK
jgi:hypothetical protein